MTKTQAEIETAIRDMKAEILADMAAGTRPETVGSFSELHDYVDANYYGGFCEGIRASWDTHYFNVVSNAVSAWLEGGHVPDSSVAPFQPGALVWAMPSVTGGKLKARVIDVIWDRTFKQWNYDVKITGRGSYYYPRGFSTWMSGRCIIAR